MGMIVQEGPLISELLDVPLVSIVVSPWQGDALPTGVALLVKLSGVCIFKPAIHEQLLCSFISVNA